MEGALRKVLFIFLGAVILSAVLLGLRSTALTSAYDANNATTVTDSSGTVHTVAASGISADTVATLYMLGLGLVWIIAIIGIIMTLISTFK